MLTTLWIFSLRLQFNIEILLSLVQDVFQKDKVNSSQKKQLFLTVRIVSKRYEKQKKNLQKIMDIKRQDILMLSQIFFSPQVKKRVIISNKHGIYELAPELLNKLRLRILGK